MASFDEGLAVGLLLGRKKGGGGTVYRDDIFHDIINNTTYLSGAEVSAGSYTVKVGVWVSPQKYGRFVGCYEDYFEMNPGYAELSPIGSGDVRLNIALYPVKSIAVPVFVVFKDGSPIYAVVNKDSSVKVEFDRTVRGYNCKVDEYATKEFFYNEKNDYRIESIQGGGSLQIVVDGYSPSIEGNCGYAVSYSYQPYSIVTDGSAYNVPVKLEKNGDRVTDGKTISFSVSYSTFSQATGKPIFSDMDSAGILEEHQGLFNACLRSAGFTTYPLTWITEDGIITG